MPKTMSYLESHPWIKFQVNLRDDVPAHLWLMLGECQSKIEHLAGIPVRPQTAQKMLIVYLAKGVHATTAIEGNTLSEKQVLARVEKRLELPPSQAYLQQEIDNMIYGCNTIAETVCKPDPVPNLSIEEISQYNRWVLKDLPENDNGKPGLISDRNVTVGNYLGAPRQDCEYLLKRLCDWLAEDWGNLGGELTTGMAILKAVICHLYLAWIHPFADGNGRTARLLEFRMLLVAGAPGPAAHLLSNHYNQTRAEYYRQLDYASKSGGDVTRFILYAIQGLRDGLRDQIKTIRAEQIDSMWRNYVHDEFRDTAKEKEIRRRHLVLDLSEQKDPVPFERILTMSHRVAQAYAHLTPRALTRDLAVLRDRKLVVKVEAGFKANKKMVLGFLPIRRNVRAPDASVEASPI